MSVQYGYSYCEVDSRALIPMCVAWNLAMLILVSLCDLRTGATKSFIPKSYIICTTEIAIQTRQATFGICVNGASMYRYSFLFMLTAISAITFAVDAASPLSGFVHSGNYTLQSIYNFTWFGLYQGKGAVRPCFEPGKGQQFKL
jgi:hypothetical protein